MTADGRRVGVAPTILITLYLTFLNLKLASSSHSSGLGDLESFRISWEGPWLPSLDNIDEEHVLQLSSNSSQLYKCIIPGANEQLSFHSSATNSSSYLNNPYKVLEPLLTNNYCSYKFEPFWVYELCHGKFLRQYHEERVHRSKITQQYHLGRITKDELLVFKEMVEQEWLIKGGQLHQETIEVKGQRRRYVSFHMMDGTECDLTNKKRRAEIFYVCNEEHNHELYSVKETSTCEYEAIVLSPLLCNLENFKTETKNRDIKCYSLAGAPRKPDKVLEEEEDEKNSGGKQGPAAYFQGKTLIIDADLLFS